GVLSKRHTRYARSLTFWRALGPRPVTGVNPLPPNDKEGLKEPLFVVLRALAPTGARFHHHSLFRALLGGHIRVDDRFEHHGSDLADVDGQTGDRAQVFGIRAGVGSG